MKTSNVLLAVGIAIAALVAAFNWPEVVKPNNRSVIMPLWRGNIWIGRRPVGNGLYKFDTLEITGEWPRKLRELQWFTTRTSLLMIHCYDRLSGAYPMSNGEKSGSFGLSLPRQLGDTVYDCRPKTIFELGRPIGRVRDVAVVTARDTLIIVPAGRFRCFEVTRFTIPVVECDTLPTISLYDKAEKGGRAYITPGIGIIKVVGPFGIRLPIGQGMLWELVKARIWISPPDAGYYDAPTGIFLPQPS